MSLNLRFRYRFEAAHRFTSAAAPSCRTPHGHTWYATALFKLSAGGLDSAEMAAEFGSVKRGWKSFITETADHSFFHNAKDPLVSHLNDIIPDARLLEFPGDPTTEMIAALFALKLKAMHDITGISTVTPLGVKIQETPTNSVTFRFEPDGTAPLWLTKKIGTTKSWWTSPDPLARS